MDEALPIARQIVEGLEAAHVLANLVGTSIRPFLNTALPLSSMTVREVQAAGD